MSCKGICNRYKAPKPPPNVGGRDGTGQKRCQICCLFLNWSDTRCPCCRGRLRIKPHNPASKERLKLAIGGTTKKARHDIARLL